MKVFRVSTIDEDKLYIHPTIPIHTHCDEDTTIKRICCSPSINGCLSSVDNLDYKNIMYVYESEVGEFYQPTEQQVYDVYLTGELWLLKSTLFTKIGRLIITGYIGQDYKDRVNNQYAFSFKQER